MWLVRELVRLVEKVILGFGAALVLALLWALVSEHSFSHDLYVTTLFLGCALLLMGAVGHGSNFDRSMDAGVTQAAWGASIACGFIRARPSVREQGNGTNLSAVRPRGERSHRQSKLRTVLHRSQTQPPARPSAL